MTLYEMLLITGSLQITLAAFFKSLVNKVYYIVKPH